VDGDQLGWVLDRWKRGDGGYDTSMSQFWETIRRVVIAGRSERGTAGCQASRFGAPDGRMTGCGRHHQSLPAVRPPSTTRTWQ
jgi:hypothetical protein